MLGHAQLMKVCTDSVLFALPTASGGQQKGPDLPQAEPDVSGLQVWLQPCLGVTTEVGDP